MYVYLPMHRSEVDSSDKPLGRREKSLVGKVYKGIKAHVLTRGVPLVAQMGKERLSMYLTWQGWGAMEQLMIRGLVVRLPFCDFSLRESSNSRLYLCKVHYSEWVVTSLPPPQQQMTSHLENSIKL